MALLLAGIVLFIGTHAFSMLRGAREAIIAAVGGEWPYKGLYAILSLAGIILIVRGYNAYRAEGLIPVWNPPAGASHLTALLMIFAMILLAATYVHSHIRSRVKHPMITAVIIWAIAHLAVNGDAGSILLFGAFLVWGILARISVGRRTKTIFAAPTLGPPLGLRNDALVILSGAGLYALFVFWIHPVLIGVPAINF